MDLSLVSLDDILEELKKRFDSCIFAGVRNTREDRVNMERQYFGDRFVCVALCEMVKELAKDDFFETYSKPEDTK